jgi:hypothetical protein
MTGVGPILLLLAAAALAPSPAPTPQRTLDIEFADAAPDFPEGWDVRVEGGVEPGVAVVFVPDAAAKKVVLRPAGVGETTTAGRTAWRFEWQDEVAMFYALPDPARLEALLARNARDTGDAAGGRYEAAAAQHLVRDADATGKCMDIQGPVESFQLVFVLDAAGKPTELLATPPGRVTHCLLDLARTQSYGPPPHADFVVVIAVNVNN